MGKLLENYGKKLWKNYGKTMGKLFVGDLPVEEWLLTKEQGALRSGPNVDAE